MKHRDWELGIIYSYLSYMKLAEQFRKERFPLGYGIRDKTIGRNRLVVLASMNHIIDNSPVGQSSQVTVVNIDVGSNFSISSGSFDL